MGVTNPELAYECFQQLLHLLHNSWLQVLDRHRTDLRLQGNTCVPNWRAVE